MAKRKRRRKRRQSKQQSGLVNAVLIGMTLAVLTILVLGK